MHDDRLIDLACAVVESAVSDYCTQIPGYDSRGMNNYVNRVNDYLRRRSSAERFFKSAWFGVLTLGHDGEEVMQYYNEKGVGHRVNNFGISK